MKNKSKVVLSKRATKFKNMGGPRKYPRKYVWQIIDNKLSLQEVTYFKSNDAYYFFTYEAGKPMVRNSRVPSDLTLFDSVKDAYNNIPEVSLLDKWY